MGAKSSASTFIDPVCGMEVEEGTSHRLEHDGQTYRFCSAECLATFRADPASLQQKAGASRRSMNS